jgi:hypothetical protein
MNNNLFIIVTDKIEYHKLSIYLKYMIELNKYYEQITIIIENKFFYNIFKNYFKENQNIVILDKNIYNNDIIIDICNLHNNNINIFDYLKIQKNNEFNISLIYESITIIRMIEMINNEGINIVDKSFDRSCALGLGDILFGFVFINNNLIDSMHINIATFLIYENSLNYLEFRIKFIKDLCKHNNILLDKILFYFDIEEDKYLANEYNRNLYEKIKNFKLNLFEPKISSQEEKIYINFHTKTRIYTGLNNLDKNIKEYSNFLSTFKVSDIYNINILGERNIPENNFEVKGSVAKIISTYKYLINLKKNNNICDLTNDFFIDNLNYDNFLNDMKILQNAKYNIVFGSGGPTCFSMIFGKQIISFNEDIDKYYILKINILKENGIYNFKDVYNFSKFIENCFCNKKIIDTIKPRLGLGDLLLIKEKSIQHNLLFKNIIIGLDSLKQFREKNYMQYLNIVISYIQLLFNNSNINISENDNLKYDLLQKDYSISKFVNLYNYLDIPYSNEYDNYIVFHTKIRFSKEYINNYFNNVRKIIINFLSSFKTTKKIVLLGERSLDDNFEKNNINILTIYHELLLLKNNNNVIDLTHDILNNGQENQNQFINDINLIYGADSNICFSIGGHFCLSFSFSKKLISFYPNGFLKFIPEYDENLNDYKSIIKNNPNDLHNSIYNFLNKIDDEYSITPRNYLSQYKTQKNAYFVGHNGLGDNITNFSAINYLSNFYNKIYFICKDNNYNNIKLLFSFIKNVEVISIDSQDEYNNIQKIYYDVINENDFFVSGFCHKGYIKSKITNHYLNNYLKDSSDNDIFNNKIIIEFYEDINLDLSIYYGFFNIPSCDFSKNLYNSIKDYKICILNLEISNIKYIYDKLLLNKEDEYIIIDINNNFYDLSKEINPEKYELAKRFINIEIIYYIDTILNANKIFIKDSCLSSIIYPLFKTNKLNTQDIYINYSNILCI